jgi:hypothetical protein
MPVRTFATRRSKVLPEGRSCRSCPRGAEEACHLPRGRYAPEPVIRPHQSDDRDVGRTDSRGLPRPTPSAAETTQVPEGTGAVRSRVDRFDAGQARADGEPPGPEYVAPRSQVRSRPGTGAASSGGSAPSCPSTSGPSASGPGFPAISAISLSSISRSKASCAGATSSISRSRTLWWAASSANA